jgi:hypothetical protein
MRFSAPTREMTGPWPSVVAAGRFANLLIRPLG